MERRGADAYYLFDDGYFQALEEALGDRLHIATVDIEGEIAASALFAETDGIVEMHLSAHDRRFDRHAPKKLLYHGVRSWAKARGSRWLHLGGGRGSTADSLLEFKAGFSPIRQPFHTLRVVIDPDRHAELVRATDPGADPGDVSGFFPPYRAADRDEARVLTPALTGA
jgi:lipid II:glycine glycyltransferase (peptidoglycan interpeptide bridge formation enzyme)